MKVPDLEAKRWNDRHDVGRAVIFKRDDGRKFRTKTRTQAFVLGGHTAVVWVQGISGCVALDRVSPAEAA